MTLRNLPMGEAVALADLITCRLGQVSSMGLSTMDSTCAMTLLAFAAGEMVSEEVYAADMLYCALEGDVVIVLPDERKVVPQGKVFAVSAGVEHAVEGTGTFKVLQIAVG